MVSAWIAKLLSRLGKIIATNAGALIVVDQIKEKDPEPTATNVAALIAGDRIKDKDPKRIATNVDVPTAGDQIREVPGFVTGARRS